jgi:hypothetical protein
MTPEEELELVKKAIVMGKTVTGCFEWHDRVLQRIERDSALSDVKPSVIRRLVIAHVTAGGIITQVNEQRPEYGDFDFYYKVVLAVPQFPTGLFVEMRMYDPDIDCPTVFLVNAHPHVK